MPTMILLLIIYSLTALVFSQSEGDSVTVNLPFGSVKGYSNGHSWQFYGIPFAAAPVEELRWSPPTDFTVWNGSTLDAKDPPPACIQNCLLGVTGCSDNMSEDCLYLNIFTPLSWRPDSETSYDILVYIYGGSFIQGTASCLLYDSRYISNYTDSIIVTFNYRVGVLGFLRIPEYGIYGNMGLIDQRMAMKWVRDYISYFGGGGKISLFGESAGAISVAAHVASPLSQGLFDSVIIQSSPWTLPLRDLEDADYLGEQFLQELNCTTTNCLYDKTSEEILAAQFFYPKTKTDNYLLFSSLWGLIIDDINLNKHPFATWIDLAEGSTLPPAIIGVTTAEGDLFIKEIEYFSLIKGQLLYNTTLSFLFPLHYTSVMETYDEQFGIPVDYIERLSLIVGDYLFLCPTKRLVATISEGQQKDIWNYLWNRDYTYNASALLFCYGIPCHASELSYVFGTVSLWGQQFSTSDLNLSRQIQTYWRNMATRSSPNSLSDENGQYAAWPRYENGSEAHLFFTDPIGTVSYGYSKISCDYLDTIGYEQAFLYGRSHITSCSLWLLVTADGLLHYSAVSTTKALKSANPLDRTWRTVVRSCDEGERVLESCHSSDFALSIMGLISYNTV